MALLERHIRPELEAALGDTPVTVIAGPRQCGKSTLAEQLAAERGARHVTLDEPAQREAANADPAGFIDQSELPVFIDEIQKAPPLLESIKSRVDRARRGGRRADGMFLLTGSANVWGTLKVSESLAGRAQRIQLWPLSQGEIIGHRETFVENLLCGVVPRLADVPTGRAAIGQQLIAGGYPEALARSDAKRRSRWLHSYVETVLERDVKDLTANAQQLEELPRLLGLVAARVSNLLEIAGISRDAAMKPDTTRRYLILLELLFLIRRAPAWSRNLGQRLIKAPKVWVPDSGLASHLVGYDETRFLEDDSGFAGALFENFVAGEVSKQATWCEQDIALHHFRTAGGREVDILIEARGGAVAGIESKLAATPVAADFSGLAHLRDKLGDRFKTGVLLHTGGETIPFGDRLWAAPVSALWS